MNAVVPAVAGLVAAVMLFAWVARAVRRGGCSGCCGRCPSAVGHSTGGVGDLCRRGK